MLKYFLSLGFIFLFAQSANADHSFLDQGVANETREELKDVGIEEKLGANLDLSLTFRNEEGVEVPLSSYFKKGKPVLLTLVYYNCPSLCNFHLNGLNDVFKQIDGWTIGDQYDVVSVSIDPSEGAEVAKKKKAAYVKAYGKLEADKGWHFLTGKQENITEIAKEVGFKYKFVEETGEFAHTAAAYVITPEGKISRYLYGIGFSPKVLRLSLIEASNGSIGTIVDKFILYCFQYDPNKKNYAFYAYNVMRAGAGVSAIILMSFLSFFWLRNRRKES
ncbi:MAG: SCO family protein [Bdellovibrionales bacterium]|nr:SCO family protein [Bdellovibrionales bacterium]